MPGLILGLGLSLELLSGCSPTDNDVQQAPPLGVSVVQADQRDVPLFIEMVGTTLGTQDVPIRARVEGFVESVEFLEGTFVSKGDLLYTIDPQPFQARLVEAQSQLAGAETSLAKTTADLGRIRPLAEIHAVSEQDLDSAVAQEAAAQAGVRASQAGVELAEIELSYTRIRAPIDGLIGLTKAKPGEFVGRDPNPVVLNTLSDIDPIRVRFSIAEREYLVIARTYQQTNPGSRSRDLDPDRSADLELILADDSVHTHKGKVMASAQSIDLETGTYSVEAAFPNPDNVLLPGQFARVRAKYQELRQVVVIPRRAVVELQGFFRVYVVGPDNTVEVRDVKLGPQAGNDIVVESGLKKSERVIVEGLQKVRAGMKVNPSEESPVAAAPNAAAQGAAAPGSTSLTRTAG